MAIKKLAFEFDPFEETGISVRKSVRKEALDEVAEFIKEQVLSHVGDGQSPVANGKFKKTLSSDYKKKKSEISGVTYANLELHGDMLDALEVVAKRGSKLSLQIQGEEAAKADGHNNFSGDSNLPAREFIPNQDKGQTFKRQIWSGVKNILSKYEEEDNS